ncbi:DUF3618 domain-containing protein [Variovorax soli]|jgi:hypothetical protein|uniref:DUF3618 domain-containing protein n=3 Tax=Variovorax soli TaxID=376815 RepID=UPI003624020A
MNHDRNSAQIQADIQRTRSELDRTLTLLERRLEPRRLVDQGVDYLRHNGASEYFYSLGRSAREQPLPLALVGVGLAWMMMTNGRSAAAPDGRVRDDTDGAADGPDGGRVHAAAQSLRSRASELGDAVSQAAHQTRDAARRTSQTLSEAAEATRARAAQVGEATRQGAQKLRSGYDQLVNEQPLALGAIGLALGAVLAAAAPRTQKEDELMGRSSDELMGDAKRSARESFGGPGDGDASSDGQKDLEPAVPLRRQSQATQAQATQPQAAQPQPQLEAQQRPWPGEPLGES